MRKPLLEKWRAIRAEWGALTLYQRFESTVARMLTLIVSVVILVALYRLFVGVITGLVLGALDPLEHAMFQTVFGEIMTLLIALEFNHTLQYVVNRTHSIIETRILLLIALLAAARTVIILVLGMTYWLIYGQDDRLAGTTSGAIGEGGHADGHELRSVPQICPAS